MDGESGVDFYLLAGVATHPGFFRACAERLAAMSVQDGRIGSRVRVLYPYGDFTRSPVGQVRAIGRDLMRGRALGDLAAVSASLRAAERMSDGVDAAAADVRRASEGRIVVLIGHSGGGVAAYRIARRLLFENAVADCRVAQIGSPKVRIRPDMRDRVGYFYGVSADGRRDPVSRIGSWGGVRRTGRALPAWDPVRYAPGCVRGIPIVGGHADYFRGGEPYVQEGRSNLDRTIRVVSEWLALMPRSTAHETAAPEGAAESGHQ